MWIDIEGGSIRLLVDRVRAARVEWSQAHITHVVHVAVVPVTSKQKEPQVSPKKVYSKCYRLRKPNLGLT